MNRLFDPGAATASAEADSAVGKTFGERYRGRYHMPLLPGENGTKSGGDWVPWGVQSATNLAGSLVESRALGEWERERCQIGLSLDPALYERQAFAVRRECRRIDLTDPAHRLADVAPELKAELTLIHEEAKKRAGGDQAARQGTNRHDVWEERGRSGLLFGTPDVNAQVERLEELLAKHHLERVPGLSERVVRNTTLAAAGRFDDVLRTTRDIEWPKQSVTGETYVPCNGRIPAGTFLMADLKTKRRAYYSWLEVRIQIAVYATAEWMLTNYNPDDMAQGRVPLYALGPKHHVSQEWGVVLWMPADGGEPQLKRVNLRKGFAHALLARQVCDARSEAKNVAAHGEAVWPA